MIDQLLREFNQKLKALEGARDIEGLKELARSQANKTSTVNRRPYSCPDDMAESMANDFGEDLFRHYETTSSAATAAAQQLLDAAV